MNRLDQCLMVTVGKIGAADTAAKENVATKDNPRLVLLAEKNNVPRRMPRRGTYAKLYAAKFDRLAG